MVKEKGTKKNLIENENIEEIKKAKIYPEGLISSMVDGLLVIDLKGKIIDVNPAVMRMYGCKNKAELINQNPLDFTLEKDKPLTLKIIRETFRKGQSNGELHAVRKDGKEIPVSIKTAVIKDSQGKKTGAFAVIRDITEQKKTQQTLLKAYEMQSALVENAPFGIFTINKNGIIDYVNPAMLMISGDERKSFYGKNFFKLSTFVKLGLAKKIRNCFKAKPFFVGPLEYVSYHSKKKTIRNFTGIPMSNEKGRVEKVMVFVEDVTRIKEAEDALRESGEKFRDLFENANDLIQSVNINKRFVYVNKKWLETLGYSKEEVKKLELTDILRRDQIPYCMDLFRRVCGGETFEKIETIFMTKDGREIYVEGTVNARFKNNKFVATRAIFRNVTERKKAEEAIRRNESKYRTLVENLPQKIFFKDKNSVYISCNENYAKDLKIKPDEIEGKTDYEFYPKKLAEKYRRDDERIMKAGEIEDLKEGYIQDGKKVFVHTIKVPVKDEKGNVIGILGVFWDITKQKKAEEELRRRAGELERFHKLAVGRELRMVELKKRIKELEEKSRGDHKEIIIKKR